MFKCLKQSLAEVSYHRTGHHVTDRHRYTASSLTYSKPKSYSKLFLHYCVSISLKLSHPREISGQEMEQRKPFDPNYTCVTLAQQSRILSRVPRHANTYVTLPQHLSRQKKVGSASNSSPLPSDSL